MIFVIYVIYVIKNVQSTYRLLNPRSPLQLSIIATCQFPGRGQS